MHSRGARLGRRKSWASLALAAWMVASPGVLLAREPTRAELEERIRRLEQIVEKHGLDKAPAKAPAAAAAEVAPPPVDKAEVEAIVDDKIKKQKVLAGWKDGFFLESPNGDFKLKLRGLLQVDARVPFGDETNPTIKQFYLRRVRPIFEATAYKHFYLKIMPDFGLGTTVLQDAYLDVNYFGPEIRFRAGKFKVPYSLERLQSAADMVFIERAVSQALAPVRDVGFQLFGDLLDGTVSYQAGAFNGTFDGGTIDGDVNNGKEMAGRVFVQPFKSFDADYVKGLGVGFAGTYGNNNGSESLANINFRTAERVSFFRLSTSSDVTIEGEGRRSRLAPQGHYYWGPFGLMGEFLQTNAGATREDSDAGTTMTDRFVNKGWFTQASWVLTGEDASYNGVVPINNFDPRNGRWGAFEIAVRGSKVNIDPDVFTTGFANPDSFPETVSEITGGINWYLNKNFKFQLNYNRTRFNRKIEINDELFKGVDSFILQFQMSY
jgi:phosphate-selective porin OprO/OprP